MNRFPRSSECTLNSHVPARSVTLHFKKPNGEIVTVEANEGDDIVDVSWEYDLDIEGESLKRAGREGFADIAHLGFDDSFSCRSCLRKVGSMLDVSRYLGGEGVRLVAGA